MTLISLISTLQGNLQVWGLNLWRLYLDLFYALSLSILSIYWLWKSTKLTLSWEIWSLLTSIIICYWVLLISNSVVPSAHLGKSSNFLTLKVNLIADRNCGHIQIHCQWILWRWLLGYLILRYAWLLSVKRRSLGREVREGCRSSSGLFWEVKACWE